MDQSRFWRRLVALSRARQSQDRKSAIDHLKASVRKVTEQAKWISSQVCRFMPQYTMHEEHHFLNVLAIMDALVPDEVIAQFEPLDCGLPILVAYTHDLGMALSQDGKRPVEPYPPRRSDARSLQWATRGVMLRPDRTGTSRVSGLLSQQAQFWFIRGKRAPIFET
jgi:hypothetical protein